MENICSYESQRFGNHWKSKFAIIRVYVESCLYYTISLKVPKSYVIILHITAMPAE